MVEAIHPRIVILLGRSGAGKGTQAKLLQEKYGLTYMGSGDLLRERATHDDFSGKKIHTVLASGGFSPTIFIAKLWMDKFEEFKQLENFKGVLFDGSPRKLLEAQLIDQAIAWYEWEGDQRVFLLDIPRDVAYQRLIDRRICKACSFVTSIHETPDTSCPTCHNSLDIRFDDKPDLINSRLDLFESEVEPVVEYYEKNNRLTRINGVGEISEIFESICKYL
ncbi:MAG: nucleoside monophosphate kinase [Candidatus Spechtbacteria bacterium]|nr:nucleoside monophosphate kinase [Candidatus Spechtbacteria bacterium]